MYVNGLGKKGSHTCLVTSPLGIVGNGRAWVGGISSVGAGNTGRAENKG